MRRSVIEDRTAGPAPRAGGIALTRRSPVTALQRLADGAASTQRAQALQRMADGRTGAIQRAMDEEEPLQGKALQRAMDEEEPLQGRSMRRRERPEASGRLPRGLRGGVEALSGQSLNDVRVHRDSPGPSQVGALAYAQGRDINLAPGQERHLPHEAWHAAQQAQGRVRPTTEVAGAPVNDDAALEREADVMGDRAVQMARARGEDPAG